MKQRVGGRGRGLLLEPEMKLEMVNGDSERQNFISARTEDVDG